jgi:hypothetical protein
MKIDAKISKEEVEDQFLRFKEVFDLHVVIRLYEFKNIYCVEIDNCEPTNEIKREIADIKNRIDSIYGLSIKTIFDTPVYLRDKEDENKIVVVIGFKDDNGNVIMRKRTLEEVEMRKKIERERDIEWLAQLESIIEEHEKCINSRTWGREDGRNVLIYDPNGDPMTDANITSAKETVKREKELVETYKKRLAPDSEWYDMYDHL